MKIFLIALGLLVLPAFTFAYTAEDESLIVKAVGARVLHKEKEFDDGCSVHSYMFRRDGEPSFQLEFKCNRIVIGWEQFSEKGWEKKNREVAELARRAASALDAGGGGAAVSKIMAGQGLPVIRGTAGNMPPSGSCIGPECVLTYYGR